jgi:hypothetical protein
MSYYGDTAWGVPGIGTAIETAENEFMWGREELKVRLGVQVSGAARDAGNTSNTTTLRKGLILGQITAQPGLWKQYDPAATDGSQVAGCVLSVDLTVVDPFGSNAARFAWAVFGGCLKAANVYGLDAVARTQMRGRFWFDDETSSPYLYSPPAAVEVPKTTSYTVVAADAGKLFTTTGAGGAVVFTLPTIAAGLGPFEFLNTVDQSMTIASAGSLDNILTFNDLAADSIAFSTAGNKIGARARLRANAAGTLWYAEILGGAHTLTVA